MSDGNAMTVEEILAALERQNGKFPREAVKAAIKAREEITPELLRIVEDTVDRAAEIVAEDPDGDNMAHLYSIYLLAQFRERRAYPLMIRFARLHIDTLDALTGDFVTEDLRRVLASVCGDDTAPIKAIIEDPSLDPWVRCAALRSLLILVLEGDMARDELMAYFVELFDGKLDRYPSPVWGALINCATSLHPAEVAGRIEMAYSERLIDRWSVSPMEVERALKQDREAVLREAKRHEKGYIGNVVREIESWAYFRQTKATPIWDQAPKNAPTARASILPRQFTDMGKRYPNEPCPCGSDKKYKKCCEGKG